MRQVVFNTPKLFVDETEQNQIKMLLEWLTGEDNQEILDGNAAIENISVYLDKLDTNSLLRMINGTNLEKIKQYISATSWNILMEFRKKYEDAKVQCNTCDGVQCDGGVLYQCGRCLFYYTKSCMTYIIVHSEQDNAMYELCMNCNLEAGTSKYRKL